MTISYRRLDRGALDKRLVRNCLLPLVLSGLLNTASGALLLSEDFDYADGSLTNIAAGLWSWHSGSGGALTLNCVSSRAFIDQNDDLTGRDDYNRPLNASFDVLADNSSQIFIGLTVNFTALPNAAVTNLSGSYFAHLKSTALNEFYARLGANRIGAASGRFRLAIASESWPATGTIQHPQDLALNQDYRVVVKFDLATDRATLWIDPVDETSLSVTSTDAPSYLAGSIATFALRQGTTGDGAPGDIYVDTVRIATTFPEVVRPVGVAVIQPQNRTAFFGQNVIFQYGLNQSAGYQWFFGNTPLVGATNSSLVLSNVTGANAGGYWAVGTNFSGSYTSRVAQLTVYDLSTVSGVWVAITNSTTTGISPELGIFSLSPSPANNELPIAKTPNSSIYYNLQRSETLAGDFQAAILSLGTVPPIWNVFPLAPYRALGFFRVQVLSAFDSLDSDGDRIDDVWELTYGLNPIFAGDANGISTFLDANNNQLTWLQAYRQLFGRDIPDKEVYGREYSVFNFGLPSANYEAISREVSLYNGESPPLTDIQEVYSREVSSFNFGEPFGSADALSREYSVFNFGEPSAPYEANSREVSVYNGESAPLTDIQEAYSREVSVFRFDLPTANYEAISREVSVFNNTLN